MKVLFALAMVWLEAHWKDAVIVLLVYLLLRRSYQYRKILKWMALLSAKIDTRNACLKKDE